MIPAYATIQPGIVEFALRPPVDQDSVVPDLFQVRKMFSLGGDYIFATRSTIVPQIIT